MDKIIAYNINKTKRFLELKFSDNKDLSYPIVWIRDNCRCKKCLFPTTDSRKTEVDSLDVDLDINVVEIAEGGKSVSIAWPDGHKANYDLDWFIQKQFTTQGNKQRSELYVLPKKLWGSERNISINKVNFSKFDEDDHSLYQGLVGLEESGLLILTDAPPENAMVKFASRLNSQLVVCPHGATFADRLIFTMKANMKQLEEHQVQAYAVTRLNFHTDLCFYQYPPGILFLQCIDIKGVEGGESIFADGINAAYQLKAKYPEYYHALCTYPVYHKDCGKYYFDFQYHGHSPVIRLDVNGDIESIRYSNYQRRSDFNIPIDQVETFYRAYKKFAEIMDENRITYLLQPGDLVVIDNTRVLHGRLPFEVTNVDGERHLKGSYMQWDDIRSTRRVLQLKLQK